MYGDEMGSQGFRMWPADGLFTLYDVWCDNGGDRVLGTVLTCPGENMGRPRQPLSQTMLPWAGLNDRPDDATCHGRRKNIVGSFVRLNSNSVAYVCVAVDDTVISNGLQCFHMWKHFLIFGNGKKIDNQLHCTQAVQKGETHIVRESWRLSISGIWYFVYGSTMQVTSG